MYFLLKRFFDVILSAIGIVFLIPMYLIIMLTYMSLGYGGKIIYKQRRIGKDGKVFYIYKFRTMVHNADEKLKELLKEDRYKQEWEANHKFENDPRITKIGKFLRKTSLDEIPQIVNVLKGDMSIIGPRPLVDGELESYNGDKKYWKIKPGITGWWACNGRSNIGYRKRLQLEYYYIDNASLYLDFVCFFKTIQAVFIQKGAK